MKHRTRAVAPQVRTAWRPARRLAARLLLALATAAAGALPAHAMEIQPPALQSERVTAGAVAVRPAAAGLGTPTASPGNDAAAERRGAPATARAGQLPAGSAPAVDVSPGRRLPEPRTWALFGVGLLAVLMMARRQRRQQHD